MLPSVTVAAIVTFASAKVTSAALALADSHLAMS
jgi:hypothetical protein